MSFPEDPGRQRGNVFAQISSQQLKNRRLWSIPKEMDPNHESGAGSTACVPGTDDTAIDSPFLVRSVAAGGYVRTNRAFFEAVGFTDAELSQKAFLDWIDAEGLVTFQDALERGSDRCSVRHQKRDGGSVDLEVQIAKHGDETFLLARSIFEVEQEEELKDADDEATISGTLHTIAQIVEEQNPGYKCSILLVADGRFVRGAGPSLPEDYNSAIDGFAIGPTVGSCGTAIYWNVPVIVEDIQADPLWVPFAELAAKAGVSACWSHPFVSKTGRVLGALALYSPEPRKPTREDLARLRAAARLTGLAVERGRAEDALRQQRKRELELEEQLRQAAKMEALGVLAGGIAHDFNNVLATILANAEFAQEILPPNSEANEMLVDITAASRRAGEFCQQMLAYSGRGSIERKRIEIGALIPELRSLVKAALSKKTTLEYALQDTPIFVEGDENQLLQVIMNLITNAAEAIGDAEGRIVVSSETVDYDEAALHQLDPQAELSPGQYLRLSVSDTGSGIDSDTIARIFDPFFTTKFTGRGLGLSAVRGIVAKHRGGIEIDSVLGEGTTFTVVLPTTVAAPNAHEEPASTPKVVSRPKRILVADDETLLRSILCRRLRHGGLEVLEAADGQEALDVFAEHGDSIDCVLLDISMPKRSGDEVQRELHAQRKDLPIVLMSGFNESEILDRFAGANIAGNLQKPITADVLLSTIRSAISPAEE